MNLFGAYLSLGNFSIWLRSVSLSIRRTPNDANHPVSQTGVNTLTLVFNSTTDPVVKKWIDTPGQRWSGSVTYVDSTGGIQRVTHFTDAFCLTVEEAFDSRPGVVSFVTTLTISAETLSVGARPHINHWPPLAFN